MCVRERQWERKEIADKWLRFWLWGQPARVHILALTFTKSILGKYFNIPVVSISSFIRLEKQNDTFLFWLLGRLSVYTCKAFRRMAQISTPKHFFLIFITKMLSLGIHLFNKYLLRPHCRSRVWSALGMHWWTKHPLEAYILVNIHNMEINEYAM